MVEKRIIIFTVSAGILAYIFIKSCKKEIADLFKSNSGFGDEFSKMYVNDKPTGTDSYEDIIRKIHNLARVDSKTVKWRRCLIASIFISVLLWFLLFTRLPTAKEMFLSILIPFLVLYGMFSYYYYHYYRFVEGYIGDHSNKLKTFVPRKNEISQGENSWDRKGSTGEDGEVIVEDEKSDEDKKLKEKINSSEKLVE